MVLNKKLGAGIVETAELTVIVSTSERQGMLSQNISKNALILMDNPEDASQLDRLDSLNVLFINTHQQLMGYLETKEIRNERVEGLFNQLKPYYTTLTTIHDEILADDSLVVREAMKKILAAESGFLTIMDQISNEYESGLNGSWNQIVNNSSLVSYIFISLMITLGFGVTVYSLNMTKRFSNDLEDSKKRLEQANLEIKSKFEKLEFLTGAIQVGIWEKSYRDHTESWSPRLYQLLGFKPNEFEGTYEKFLERVHPADLEMLNKAAARSLKLEKPSTVEIRVRMKCGAYKWVEASGNVKRGDDHKVVLMIGGVMDINQKKILESQLKVFVKNAPAAIAMFDKKMNYVTVSNQWGEDYQLDIQKIIGENFYNILPEIGDEWKKVHQRCLEGAIEKNDEDQFIRADGNVQWMKWEIRPWYISDDEIGGVLMLTEDITESKVKEAELSQAKDEAIRASKAKEQFLATMSHEMRTPLNAINGLTHFLLSENPKDDQVDSLNLLKFSADNLLVLINDILDISKIESGKLKLDYQAFDFFYLVENIQKSLVYKAKENMVTISTDYDDRLPQVFVGDSARITQIIYNLAGNAIKFTEKGNVKISIEYLSDKRGAYTFRVSVVDDGIGISSENQKKIFKSFEQADSGTARKYGGTGLGLYISKKLLQLMDSDIKLESELEKGSNFYFDLKLEKSSVVIKENGSDELNNLDFSGKDISILIAEDNMANQIVMKKFLTRANINHKIVENGSLVLEELASMSYDLIFMDLQMPVMDGYSATSAIRSKADPYFRQIPIIALTADAFSDIRVKALEVGMDDYLSKPFKPSDLYKIIHKYAERVKETV